MTEILKQLEPEALFDEKQTLLLTGEPGVPFTARSDIVFTCNDFWFRFQGVEGFV